MEKIRRRIEDVERSLKSNESSVDHSLLNEYGLKELTLRPYQLEGVQWMIARYKSGIGCILADEMGLGKTCQTISFLVFLYGKKKNLSPSLILLPLSVVSNWKDELKRFAPHLRFVCYVGGKDERLEKQTKMKHSSSFNILITTYEICLKDEEFLSSVEWQTLVVDEGHRLKNRQSQLHQVLKNFSIVHRILLTGTPVQNNLDELFSLLSFVQADIFRPKFAEQFVDSYKDVISDSESDISKILFPFLLRRVKSQVLKDLPQKSEVILYHGLSSLQKKYYKAILTKDIDAFETEYGANRTRLSNILMQLRKCVNHPYLFDGVEPEPFELGEHLVEASGKLIVLDRLLEFLNRQKHKVLIFSQMTRVLDILQDYMGFRGYSYERLDGSVRAEERFLAIQNFNKDDSTFAFLLSTKAGGQGLNLTAADTVVFVDSDFNPQNDLQASARAHRIGQMRNVKVIRLVGRSTVEEIILKRAEEKLRLTKAVIIAGQSTSDLDDTKNQIKIEDILKFGLDKLFANDDSSVEDINFSAILGRSTNGEWEEDSAPQANDTVAMELDEPELSADGNFYVFEGKDYSKEPSAADIKVFQQLIDAQKTQVSEAAERGRARRNTKNPVDLLVASLPVPVRKPRKQLSPEELEERRRKRMEKAALRAKEEEEEEIRREQERRRKREEKWKRNNYTSCNIDYSSAEDEEEDEDDGPRFNDEDRTKEEEEDTGREKEEEEEVGGISYVVGDVTHPQNTKENDAIIVHVLDNSGVWGYGGVFTSLSNRSLKPKEAYQLAGKMKDLALGDVHIVSIDDIQSRPKGSDWLAMIVAQKRDSRNNLSGIKMAALRVAFKKLSIYAKEKKASVHFPRIGYNTVGFNWYGTERLIRKYFVTRRIPTYAYYFPRSKKFSKRKHDATDEETQKNVKRLVGASPQLVTSGGQLPDFFNGTVVYFHGLTEDSRKRMARYVIAFNGDVQSKPDQRTTHIVTVGDKDSVDEFLEGHGVGSGVRIVKVDWITDSIMKRQLITTDEYLLN